MLSLLLELFVSLVLCGTFVFFAFLNAPVEAGANDDDDSGAVNAGGEPALLPSRDLPLYTALSRYVSLSEDTASGAAYRWLLLNALHYTPREVYSEAHLRAWENGVRWDAAAGDMETEAEEMEDDNDEDDEAAGGGRRCRASPSATSTPAPVGPHGTPPPPPRRVRRRHRRGGPTTSAAPPTPLRHESAHWVNVVLRWGAFLYLGGGTVTPDVWTDHLLYHAERVLSSVNAAYEEKMRARAAVVSFVVSQLAGGSPSQQPQQQSTRDGVSSFTPPFHPPLLSSSLPFSAPAALLRVELMELGAGLLGRPAREVGRPQFNARDGLLGGRGGRRHDGLALPGNLSPSLSAVRPATAGGNSGAVNPLTSPNHAGGGDRGGVTMTTPNAVTPATSSSPPLSSNSPHPTPHVRPTHNSAIAAAGVLLSTSMAGLGSVLADVVASVTTANAGSSSSRGGGPSGGDGGGNGGSGGIGDGDYGGINPNGAGPTAGAQLGVVLPRVEGDVISVEQPYVDGDASTTSNPGNNNNSSSHPSSTPSATSALPLRPLRCFAVPLLYEDQRFHLRLGCCLPFGALLPVALCVPPDVLTLDCAVAVRRVIFNGHLYAALHGAQVELSFPVAPQFTAVVEVTPDYANAVRGVAGRGGGGGGGSSGRVPFGRPTRPPTHVFTAVNTTRNEVAAVRDGGREASPSSRPPLPSAATTGGPTMTTNTTATGTSSINAGNEKVQEVVLLAVRRLIQSLTYPNVLAGQLMCVPVGSEEGGTAAAKLSMKWQRTTASLPLRM